MWFSDPFAANTDILGRMIQLMNLVLYPVWLENKIDFVNKMHYASERVSYYFQGLNKLFAGQIGYLMFATSIVEN